MVHQQLLLTCHTSDFNFELRTAELAPQKMRQSLTLSAATKTCPYFVTYDIAL
jgi:hypothetical protein